MSCGKRSRPRNVTGLEAVEWYKEHRCEVSLDTGCYRWRPEFHEGVEYLKRRYAPDRLMLMLTGRDGSTANSEERQHLVRKTDCTFTDCINPFHLELHPPAAVRAMVYEGYFWNALQTFEWHDGTDSPHLESTRVPPELGSEELPDEIESKVSHPSPRPSWCLVGQLRCTVQAGHTWNHYNREYVPIPGFEASVRLHSDVHTLFQCDGFEALDDAKAYCEALVRGDRDEVTRLVHVAKADRTRRGEDEFNWVDEVEYGTDEVGREAANFLAAAIDAGLDELARRHQLSESLTRRRFWEDVIEHAEGLARQMLEAVPANIGGEKAGQSTTYGKEPLNDSGPAGLQILAKGYRTREGVIQQNGAGGYRLADDLIEKGDTKWATALFRHLNTVLMAVSENGSEVVDLSDLDPNEIEVALWIRLLLADSYGDELAVALMNVAHCWEWSYNEFVA